ncbi:MAG TPA: cache domain-containing protein [Stellaceae bacterium]|nr:cache domain-containing protein [Stellaceae bacterium]
MTDRQSQTRNRPATLGGARQAKNWPTYLGITGLLLFILVALVGGIIWYNSKKSSELAIAAAQRLMQEADEKIIDRIRLLYDPMYAIVGIASLVPELTKPTSEEDANAKALLLRALRIYPQILSLYVGFDNGDFSMITHIAGEKADALRKQLEAPHDAVFANEIVTVDPAGQRSVRWVFFAEDGAVVGRRDDAPPFDPRKRPWYTAAKNSDVVEHSDLYVFASNALPGFTLSRSFTGPTPGVMGADLAAVDLANFLRQQRITPGSTAFIFTKAGEIVALPDQSRFAKAVHANGEVKAMLPKIADLNDPVIEGLVTAYRNQQMAGTRIYNVAGRTYIGRVTDIPPRYGRDQLLAIAVPVDEIVEPIIGIRNDTLLYSLAFLVFALPLCVTLVVMWIDRRLAARAPWPQFRDDE